MWPIHVFDSDFDGIPQVNFVQGRTFIASTLIKYHS